MDLLTLPVVSTLSDHIDVVEKDDIKILRVTHPKASAGISLHGAHILSFRPAGHADVIWMSSKAKFNGTASIRGGIPICWPWFGPIGSPSHGFARISEWTLIEHRENDQGVVICLGLEDSEETQKLWPYQFSTRLYVEIGDELNVSLEVTNTDEKPWLFSGALHSYLNVGDIHQVETTGMGERYIDKLQDSKECEGPDVLALTGPIDRVYTQPEPIITIHDPELSRQITIENHGHNTAVLWNPWADGHMADMTDDGYATMLCVESTIYAPCISAGHTLAPNESHTLATTIRLVEA
ncbi:MULTISPECIES: D-hexose-6-phosphate mutarotase [Vibrio]|uniref:Putative glucose-6-phosphate 1-epimerase n=2 Tax=Vibrio TaxID=662 RepID=A0A7X4LKI4_9VIBR|nr:MULTISPECIES: D-hexose-6-phosphate mutarotase [Vibrio]MBF8999900.1 D-hexose-6-phosphate mutarotase [Vibrio nitrifigilis]MZI93470.1 D-hexose-6-phosphate mutarotase [Vibrio eleionomae]